jgi:phage FluMu protein Com
MDDAVDLRDVRRLSMSALVVGGVVLLWLLFLSLDDAGLFEWEWPTTALAALSLHTWQWLGAVVLLALVGLVALSTYSVGLGGGRVPTRQVQCQSCRAVFFIPDNGRRPLTHPCPNCKALGVYDGKAPPVGRAPEVKPHEMRKIPLTCRSCEHRFSALDTGIRPLSIECPNCKAVGEIR